MANRSIQAKVLKMKKAKRLFPKSYSANVVSVGKGPNMNVLHEYKERAQSIAFDEVFWDRINPPRFKGITPAKLEVNKLDVEKIPYRERDLNRARDEKREEVLRQIQRIEEYCPALMCFTILENRYQRARIFFNSERTCFILMHENYKTHQVRTSMSYGDKHRCAQAFYTDKMKWVEFGHCSRPPQKIDAEV